MLLLLICLVVCIVALVALALYMALDADKTIAKRNALIDGFLSVFGFGTKRYKRPADDVALRGDWEKVCKDFERVMGEEKKKKHK
jgi:hypothetical protein